MNLVINNPDNLDLNKFCKWLITKMQEYIRGSIDKRKLEKFDTYFNENVKLNWIDGRQRYLSTYDLLIIGTYNLVISKSASTYIIQLSTTALYPNSYNKIINLIKLVNNGNLVLQNYPIYDTMMKHFADELDDYYNEYQMEAS